MPDTYIYRVDVYGRPIGAIGIFHWCRLTITSPVRLDVEQIRLKCYETHEHIMGLRFEEVTHAD